MDGMVIGVWIFIFYSLLTLWISDIYPFSSYWLLSFSGSLHLFLFHCVAGMVMYSFYLACDTPPGSPKKGWIPLNATQKELDAVKQEAMNSQQQQKVKNIILPQLRYCVSCQEYKPPRTFHCKECDLCILRMDHHCPWIGNCVGYSNHKNFVLFVTFAAIGCAWVTGIHIWTGISVLIHNQLVYGPLELMLLLLDFVFLIPTTLGLLSLSWFQWAMAIENTTTVEQRERNYTQKQIGEMFVWKYDFGSYFNVCSLMGPDVFQWFIPSGPPVGSNGTEFKIHGQNDSRSWLPPEDTKKKEIVIELDSDDDYEPTILTRTKRNK